MRGWVVLAMAGGLLAAGCRSGGSADQVRTPAKVRQLQDESARRAVGEDDARVQGTLGLQALGAGIESLFKGIGRLIDRLGGGLTPAKAARQLVAESADQRREAVYYLSDFPFGRQAPYIKQYANMAFGALPEVPPDADYSVRAAAIRALNRARASQYTPGFIAALADKSELVRLEAAKALANMGDSKAIEPLLRRLANAEETRDVRIAAADALRVYRSQQVAQELTRRLADRDFGVVWQARRSLIVMTGQDFGYNQGAWLDYLARQPVAAAPAMQSAG